MEAVDPERTGSIAYAKDKRPLEANCINMYLYNDEMTMGTDEQSSMRLNCIQRDANNKQDSGTHKGSREPTLLNCERREPTTIAIDKDKIPLSWNVQLLLIRHAAPWRSRRISVS